MKDGWRLKGFGTIPYRSVRERMRRGKLENNKIPTDSARENGQFTPSDRLSILDSAISKGAWPDSSTRLDAYRPPPEFSMDRPKLLPRLEKMNLQLVAVFNDLRNELEARNRLKSSSRPLVLPPVFITCVHHSQKDPRFSGILYCVTKHSAIERAYRTFSKKGKGLDAAVEAAAIELAKSDKPRDIEISRELCPRSASSATAEVAGNRTIERDYWHLDPGERVPYGHVVRSEERCLLKLILSPPGSSAKRSRWYFLCGPLGSGKTTIARGIVNSKDLRTLYPDGVIWIRLRKEWDRHSVLRLAENEIRQQTAQDIRFNRRDLDGRKCLCVLDGATSMEQLRALDVMPPTSIYLVTTWDKTLFVDIAPKKHQVYVSFPSSAYLKKYLNNLDIKPKSTPLLHRVLQAAARVENHPLLLRLFIGRLSIADEYDWEGALTLLQSVELDADCSSTASYPHRTLLEAIHAFMQNFTVQEEKATRWLSLFEENYLVSSKVIHFAMGTSDLPSKDIERVFHKLVRFGVLQEVKKGYFSIHSVLREYFREQSGAHICDMHASLGRRLAKNLEHTHQSPQVADYSLTSTAYHLVLGMDINAYEDVLFGSRTLLEGLAKRRDIRLLIHDLELSRHFLGHLEKGLLQDLATVFRVYLQAVVVRAQLATRSSQIRFCDIKEMVQNEAYHEVVPILAAMSCVSDRIKGWALLYERLRNRDFDNEFFAHETSDSLRNLPVRERRVAAKYLAYIHLCRDDFPSAHAVTNSHLDVIEDSDIVGAIQDAILHNNKTFAENLYTEFIEENDSSRCLIRSTCNRTISLLAIGRLDEAEKYFLGNCHKVRFPNIELVELLCFAAQHPLGPDFLERLDSEELPTQLHIQLEAIIDVLDFAQSRSNLRKLTRNDRKIAVEILPRALLIAALAPNEEPLEELIGLIPRTNIETLVEMLLNAIDKSDSLSTESRRRFLIIFSKIENVLLKRIESRDVEIDVTLLDSFVNHFASLIDDEDGFASGHSGLIEALETVYLDQVASYDILRRYTINSVLFNWKEKPNPWYTVEQRNSPFYLLMGYIAKYSGFDDVTENLWLAFDRWWGDWYSGDLHKQAAVEHNVFFRLLNKKMEPYAVCNCMNLHAECLLEVGKPRNAIGFAQSAISKLPAAKEVLCSSSLDENKLAHLFALLHSLTVIQLSGSDYRGEDEWSQVDYLYSRYEHEGRCDDKYNSSMVRIFSLRSQYDLASRHIQRIRDKGLMFESKCVLLRYMKVHGKTLEILRRGALDPELSLIAASFATHSSQFAEVMNIESYATRLEYLASTNVLKKFVPISLTSQSDIFTREDWIHLRWESFRQSSS